MGPYACSASSLSSSCCCCCCCCCCCLWYIVRLCGFQYGSMVCTVGLLCRAQHHPNFGVYSGVSVLVPLTSLCMMLPFRWAIGTDSLAWHFLWGAG